MGLRDFEDWYMTVSRKKTKMASKKKEERTRSEVAAGQAREEVRALLALLEAPDLLNGEAGTIDMGTMHSALELHARAHDAMLKLMMYACDAATLAVREAKIEAAAAQVSS